MRSLRARRVAREIVGGGAAGVPHVARRRRLPRRVRGEIFHLAVTLAAGYVQSSPVRWGGAEQGLSRPAPPAAD